MIDIAFTALLPLFYSTPIQYGGLGLSPSNIGIILGTYGLAKGIVQVTCFAKVVKRFGPKKTFLGALCAFFILFPMFPVMNLLARRAGGLSPAVWAAISFQLVIGLVRDMSYGEPQHYQCSVQMILKVDLFSGSIFIYMSSSAPSQKSLGAINGLGQTSVAICRAIGPATANSLFALSVKYNICGGYGVYVFLVILAGFIVSLGSCLPKEPWKRG